MADNLNINYQVGQADFDTLAQLISTSPYSSQQLDDAIARAVGLYLLESDPNATLEDLKASQQEVAQELRDYLGSDNGAAIDGYLDQYLANVGVPYSTAQATPERPAHSQLSAGEPVNLATGQFVHSVTDFVVAGAGIDFEFVRTYKSGTFYQGPLGPNWDHAYNLWLVDNGNGTVTVMTGRLRPIRYILHQAFPYYLATGDDNVVIATDDGAFEQRSPNGQVVRFEQLAGMVGTVYWVVRIADRFGNTLSFSYDDQNRLSTVNVNNAARTVAFLYDDQSRIQSIVLFPVTYTTPTGPQLVQRTWTYTYDDFGDLVMVTSPTTDEYPYGRTTQYAYSSPSSFVQRQHDLLTITDPNGTMYLENEFGSDAFGLGYGRVVRQRIGSGEFLFDYAQVIPEPAWSFSDADRPTSCVTVIQRDGHPVTYILNALGNVLAAEEAITGTIQQQVVWRYAYDADGRRTTVVSPEGRVTQIYYGREDFYRRQIAPGDPSIEIWQDPNLSLAEHARFSNVIATVRRSATLKLPGLLNNLAIYGKVFPDVLVVALDDIIVKRSYESRFQQLATISDPRFTASPDPAAPESQNPASSYSKHLAVTSFNGDAAATIASVTYPDTIYPAPLPNGSTGVASPKKTYDAYDPHGRLLQWTEPEGNVLARAYFPPSAVQPSIEGFLASSTTGVGVLDLRTAFAVNEAGQVIATTSPLNNSTKYALDAFSLVRTVFPPIPGYEIRYNYDGNAQMLRRFTAIIDPNGTVVASSPELVSFTYNEEMSVVVETLGDSSSVPPRNTRRIYDTSNRLVRLIFPRGNFICYEYNQRSLPTRITRACCEPEASTVAYIYDLDDAPISIIDPRGGVTSAKLDAFARPVAISDALGTVHRLDFDKLNNVVIRRLFGPSSQGKYPLLRHTEYEYDERGYVIRERKAYFKSAIPTADPWAKPDAEFTASVNSGGIQWYETLTYRDGNLRIFRVVDANGHATCMEYDVADRLVAITDPASNVTRATYDADGGVVRRDQYFVDAGGTTRAVISTLYEFDAMNRLTATVDGAGNRFVLGLDSRGLPRTATDALGHVRKYGYNGFRECITATEVLLPRVAGGPTLDLITARSFDPNGNLIAFIDPVGNTTMIEYDPLDRPKTVINPAGTSHALSYDRSDNLTDLVDEEGVHLVKAYDAGDRLTSITVIPPTPVPSSADLWAQYSYDGASMLTEHSNSFLSVASNYDSLGRCYQETLTFGPPLNQAPALLTLSRQFDPVSNTIGRVYPSGQRLVYDLGIDDRLLRLRSVVKARGYPGYPGAPANRVIVQEQRWGELTIQRALGNAVVITSAYDPAARPISDDCKLANGSDFVLQQLWDGAGNRALSIEDNVGIVEGWWHQYDSTNRLLGSSTLPGATPVVTAPLAAPTAPLPIVAFRGQQLINALIGAYGVKPAPQPEFGYDSPGNRTNERVAGSNVIYTVNILNEYLTVGRASFRYDRAGRMVDDSRFTFGFNFRGQLVQATAQTTGKVVLQVFHDAIGRPVGIVEGTRARALVMDDLNLVESYDNGVLSAVYLYESRDRLCFFAAGGKDHFVFRDVLGSVRLTSDFQGALAGIFRYDSFGKLLSGSPASPLLYCGKYLYSRIGWYEYQMREYIPELGRFAQPDPAGFVDGANLYSFVRNNPLSAVDPTGTDRQSVTRAAGSIINRQGAYDWQHYVFAGESGLVYGPGYSSDPFGKLTYSGPTCGGMPPAPLAWDEFYDIQHVPKSAFHTKSDVDYIWDPFPIWRDSHEITVDQANQKAWNRMMARQCDVRKEALGLLVGEAAGRFLFGEAVGELGAERATYRAGNEAIAQTAANLGTKEMTTEELADLTTKMSTARRSNVARTRSNMADQDLASHLNVRGARVYGPGGASIRNLFRKHLPKATSLTIEGATRETYMKILLSSGKSNKWVDLLLTKSSYLEPVRNHAVATYVELISDWLEKGDKKEKE
jgi:RHS repeat-associated protein